MQTTPKESPRPLTELLRHPNAFIRGLNLLVLSFFVVTFYAPSALAIKVGIEEQEKQAALEASQPENQSELLRYSQLLNAMKGHFQEAERLYTEQENSLIGTVTDVENAIQTGDSLFQDDERWKLELNKGLDKKLQAVELNAIVDQDFVNNKDWIEANDLPEVFLQRHHNAYDQYQQNYQTFIDTVRPVEQASDDKQRITKLRELNQWLATQQFGRKHQAFDKDQLGNFTPNATEKNANPVSPELSQSQLYQQGWQSNPQIHLAALDTGVSNFDISQLPGADDPAFLAETDEVVLSKAIIDKAAELEHNPVKIYHWVRNHIEHIPGFGSYQNAELTLGAQRGNAFDIASLTIALLRASKIPARYAFGVAEIDAERYTNWLGNFENADVASDYASANGVAVTTVTGKGRITKLRTQHVWVQAAADFFPSRGAKNRSADAWVDIDPSFKQYDYQQGLDAVDISGIDAEALANQFVNSGTVNENQGFVQNLDPTELLNAQEQAQTALQDYIKNNLTDPTVGEVIGGRRTIIKDYPTLPSGLPYKKFAQGATYAFIPPNLQNKIAVGFGNNRTVFPFAKVNNQKVTFKFTPATQADEDALAALLPEGEIKDISQLPSAIPGYLIRVIPQLALNGNTFLSGSAMRLGEEIDLSYQQSGPLATYAPYSYSVIAGSFLNIPLIAQSISPTLLQTLQDKVEQTKTILENADPNELNTLTREDILGDLFYAGGLGYFAQYSGLSHIAALQSKGEHKLEVGYGSYGYEPNVSTFFGIPRAIQTGGAGMNIRIGRSVETHTGNQQLENQLRFQTGLISSALEHAVPEQMFSDPQNPTDGVSAVKALQLAARQGQKIYQIDQNNLNQALNDINLHYTVEQEIRTAINQGQIAIAHQQNIQAPGWSGAGYLILDPAIMDGSYKISGGSNGGFLKGLYNKILLYVGLWLGFAKNHPALSKLIAGSLGLLLGSLTRIIKLLFECPIGIALIGTLITVGWNILFLTINVALAASGVGALLLYPLAALEFYLESLIVDKFIEQGCS